MAQPLAQLLTACAGLKATFDAALTTEGIPTLASLAEQPVATTGRLRTPEGTVSLAGSRTRTELQPETGTMDRVTVTWQFRIDGPESTALRYEGALAAAIRAAKSTLNTAVTTASLFRWELSGGTVAGDDDDRRNVANGAWLVQITCIAELEW